jgi:fused signal recognition particle receptor
MENNKNLMMQLQKINNVVFKLLNKKIDEKLFILDANTGQNGILQVKTFQEYIDLTGLILTKLDGSSKGGIIFSIKNKLNLPVKFIGTGEMVTDLQLFNIDTYLESFFAKEK